MSRVINAAGEILVNLNPTGGQTMGLPATLDVLDIGTYILVSSAGTLTLPPAADVSLFVPTTIKNLSAGQVIVDADGSELIDGELTKTIAFQYSAMTLISDGAGWYIV